jgi:polysaccharide pyruvyl transferase WcaK-like protein
VFTTAGILFGYEWYDPRRNFLSTLLPLLWIARRNGARVVGLYTGVTPPSTWAERLILRKSLSMHNAIATRDKDSRDIVRNLTNTPAKAYADISFLEIEKYLARNESIDKQESSYFAVNIASYLDKQKKTNKNKKIKKNEFVKKVAKNLDKIIKKTNLEIVFVATSTGDSKIHKKISKNMQKDAKHEKLYEMKLFEALKVMKKMKLATTTRMHASILAASMKVPLIALSYNPKVDSLMDQIEMSEWVRPVEFVMSNKWIEDIKRLIEVEKQIKNKLSEVAENSISRIKDGGKFILKNI